MGIKGTVRRNQDGHFIHANVDLDIIITEEVTLIAPYYSHPNPLIQIPLNPVLGCLFFLICSLK